MSSRPDYQAEERVVGAQARELNAMRRDRQAASDRLNADIDRAEALAARIGAGVSARRDPSSPGLALVVPVPTLEQLVAMAPPDAGLHDALDETEVEAALAHLEAAGRQACGPAALDRSDWVIAVLAGLLAGAADLVLVWLPQHPFSSSGPQGGALPEMVRKALGRVLPPGTVSALEKAYPVPFDPSTNRGLLKPVHGLYPMSHRFQSPGHDPLLGWFFGVRDVLDGTFTAFGRDGMTVVQHVTAATAGQDVFHGLLEAFGRVGGHMLSDVSTPMGLPAPLMPLGQLLQFGNLGPEGHSVAEVVRRMYLEGYDFRHFVAGGLAATVAEVVVRGAWLARRLHEGSSFRDALPDAAQPRLRRQLLVAHATATAFNLGKVAIMQNPLALNWAQWLACLRYVGPELAQILDGPASRIAARDELLDDELRAICLLTQSF